MEIHEQIGNFSGLLVLPPAITVAITMVLLGFTKWRKLLWENGLIFSLLSTLILLNIIEIITYGNVYKNYDFLIRIFYCVMFISASIILCLSEQLNSKELFPRKFIYFISILISSISIILVLATNLIIQGAEIHEHSISRIPGNYYWIFQIYILACVAGGTALIYRSILIADTLLDKKRRIVILFSFIPLVFSVLLVIILMLFGIEITWSLFLPFSTLIFLIFYLFTENKKDLFRFLVNVPYSDERKAYSQLNIHILEYIAKTQTNEPIPLKNLMSEIEKIFITNALEIKDGNHNLAAELLSISLSTVYRHKGKSEKQKQT